MKQYKLSDFLPFMEASFEKDKDFTIPVAGVSMLPLLVENRDYIILKKCDLPLEVGDVPLYQRDNGQLVLHRIIEKKADGEYIMSGDNQFLLEGNIYDKNIIAVAKAFIIDGKEVDVSTDTEYLKYKNKFVKNARTRYPVRRLRHLGHRIIYGK